MVNNPASWLQISRRGVIFKTYEGTLNLSPNGIMTPWDFSADNQQISEKLQQFDGKMVVVHYKQRYQFFILAGRNGVHSGRRTNCELAERKTGSMTSAFVFLH